MQPLLFDSVGLEIEIEDLPRPLGLPSFRSFRINQEHDASCERDQLVLGNFVIRYIDDASRKLLGENLNTQVVGCELITSIIDAEGDYLDDLIVLLNNLKKQGESTQSYRAGFHIHVNFPFNLRLIKKLLEVGAFSEKLFFSIAGMGYDYRGLKNDSTYCRPITKFGPPVVRAGSNSFAQCYTIKSLLEAKDSADFMNRYGDLRVQLGNRYVPVRYSWLNLVPIFLDRNGGNIEFRLFNKTLNPYYMQAAIELSRLIVKVATIESIKPSFTFEENSIYDEPGNEREILDTLLELSGGLDSDVYDTILKLISPFQMEKEYVFTHLMFLTRGDITRRHWVDYNVDFSIEKIKSDLIKKPKFEDIHILRETGQRLGANPTEEEFIDLEERIPPQPQEEIFPNRIEPTPAIRTNTTTDWTANFTNTERVAENFTFNGIERQPGEDLNDYLRRARNIRQGNQ